MRIITIPKTIRVDPPSTPVLTATANGQTQIDLSAASISSVGIAQYYFEYAASSGGPWTALTNNATGTYSDTSGLTAGSSRSYRVYVLDASLPAQQSGYSATASATTDLLAEPFPRIVNLGFGGYNWGSSTAKRDWMSKHRAIWGDWFAGSNTDATHGGSAAGSPAKWDNVLADVKSRSAARGGWLAANPTKIYKYGIIEAVYKAAGNDRFVGQQSAATTNNWRVRDSYPSGSVLDSWYGSTEYAMNASDGCHTAVSDGVSVNWAQYTAQQELKQCIVSGTQVGGAVTNCDGFGLDNVFSLPRCSRYGKGNGDYDESGTGESDATAAASYRRGYRQAFDFAKAYSGFGSRDIGGNPDNDLSATEYQGLLNFALFEGAAGYAWSTETGSGWVAMMLQAETLRSNLKAGGRLFFHFAFNGPGGGTYTAAQLLEPMYYYASSLLLDVSTAIVDENNGGYGGTFWMDAYDFNLGQPVDTAGYASWSGGVRRRRFDNGDAYANPKGNGAPTVALGKTMYVLRGNAAGWLTPGASVTSLTFPAERTGIVLSSTPT